MLDINKKGETVLAVPGSSPSISPFLAQARCNVQNILPRLSFFSPRRAIYFRLSLSLSFSPALCVRARGLLSYSSNTGASVAALPGIAYAERPRAFALELLMPSSWILPPSAPAAEDVRSRCSYREMRRQRLHRQDGLDHCRNSPRLLHRSCHRRSFIPSWRRERARSEALPVI